MKNEHATRRALVKVALWMSTGTPLAPSLNERKLLAQYLRGVLTLDQLLELAEDRIQTTQAMNGLRLLTAEGPLLQGV